jgi:hypothetical protein
LLNEREEPSLLGMIVGNQLGDVHCVRSSLAEAASRIFRS